jgi:uncharacterized protein YecE (DUF72 family)
MTEPIMIGTRGWEHAPWLGDFYPAELPADWRFCYYSNNLRSVLVPQEVWPGADRAQVAQWAADSDPAFRFVIELPAALGALLAPALRERELEQFRETIEPVTARLAGLLLRIAAGTRVHPDGFEPLLKRLADIAPLCVDLPDGPWRAPAQLAALARQGAGLAWNCQSEPAPHPGGGMMVALAPPAGAHEVHHYIEQLAQWQQHDARAGLFFVDPERAARAAQEARLIAELMGV